MKSLKIALLYYIYPSAANAYFEHIESFGKYSQHSIHTIPICSYNNSFRLPSLEMYDVIIFHYGFCFYNPQSILKPEEIKEVSKFKGLKVYFGQDEYTTPEYAVKNLKALGIHHIFSCISDEKNFRKVYPKSKLPNLTYTKVLTGYVSDTLREVYDANLQDRPLDIVYRGNNLGLVFGKLGAEKFEIGMRMKEVADKHQLKTDIKWLSSDKILGNKWFKFLRKGRIMLCTESGSSIIHTNIYLKTLLLDSLEVVSSSKSVEEFRIRAKKFYKLIPNDGDSIIAEVSPKVFEAIACGTVLLCYEGNYSGIIKPNIHYIPLKKDFSNISEVLTKISDIKFLKKIQQRAYKDIILSQQYTYKTFIKKTDQKISELFEALGFQQKSPIPPQHKYIEAWKGLIRYRPFKTHLLKLFLMHPILTSSYIFQALVRKVLRYKVSLLVEFFRIRNILRIFKR